MNTKVCISCEVEKPVEDFHPRSDSPDGRRNQCRVCRAERDAAYHQANRDHRNELKRGWYEANRERAYANVRRWKLAHPERNRELNLLSWHRNPEANRARQKAWADSNREQQRQAVRKASANYRREHPEAVRLEEMKRRARKRAAFVEDVHALVVLEMDDGECGICGEDVDPFAFDVDHIIPLALGGAHSYVNVQASHPLCNRSKGARLQVAA